MFCWLAVAALMVAMVGCESKKAAETAEFETAADAVKKMTAGWNLGNTLDAFSTDVAPGSPTDAYETCWGEPVAEEFLIKQFKDKGFDVVRVPVTWWQHMDEEGTVDSVWMARVETVVNYVLNNGMYCIVNVHHDTGAHADSWIKADSANYEANPEQLYIFNLLPVLGEEGDFYKVGIYNNWRQIETAYVPKSSCSDIATGPITDEVLEQQAYCTCMLVKEGDKKCLFLTTNFGDEDAEIIQLGMLSGDCILEPEHPEISCVFSEDAKEIRVEVNKETNSCTVFYGPAQSHEEEGEITVRVVDVSKLTAEQIDTLYNWAKSSLGTHVRACYYFPSYHAFDSSFQLQPFFYPNK